MKKAKPQKKAKKVLIVDDEQDFCFFLKKYLDGIGGFDVTCCYNGKDGVALAKKILPDLILLDIMMPEMDGSEAAAQLKNDSRTKGIKIIFLTGIVSKDEVDRVKNVVGGHYFMAKPLDMEKAIKLINSVL